ncbi:MAG: cobyric acid synthase [Erythrobacter sp.]
MAALMLQGTGSDVGKSVLVAGLCRLFANRGLKVIPFKPQNMSNNAAVTSDGGEIGRAQAVQALAARIAPHSDMNPVLIKPQSDRTAQIVIQGQMQGTRSAGGYQAEKARWLEAVLESYRRLETQADLVLVEGAGSPAEINLRRGDIANMGFARAANVPVVLVGDIDRGGVIAAVAGTRAVLDPDDAAMIHGFIINRFRGDPALFEDGYRMTEQFSGWRGLGVVPWIDAARRLPAEDAVVLDAPVVTGGKVVIAVPMLSRIANFDDFDALAAEPEVRLMMVPPGALLPAEASLVILPGTKATIADLAFLRAQGWDIDLSAHIRRGGQVLGICGGYQMLGTRIADPDGIEGPPGEVEGLGYLPVTTRLAPHKRLAEVTGVSLAEAAAFRGYEIHCGITGGTAPPLLRLHDGRTDGAVSTCGRIAGCYVHGLFNHPAQRTVWLARLGAGSDGIDHAVWVDEALDELAEALERHLDIAALARIAGLT